MKIKINNIIMKRIKESMEENNKKYTLYLDYIVSILLTTILKIILIILKAYPLKVTGDELFLFYLPAKLSGLDWSGCMENYRYYGYGFSFFLFPLFKIIENPVLLYKVILIIVAIIQSIIPIVCCYLLRNYFNIKNIKINILVTICCTYCVSLCNTYMYNDHIYIIYVWIAFLCIIKLSLYEKEKNKKLVWSIALGMTFIGALTIHQRALTLVLAYIILYFLAMFLLKKKIGYFSVVIFLYIIGAFADKKIVEWNNTFLKFSNQMGNNIEGKYVDNSDITAYLSFNGRFWEDKEYLEAVQHVTISNLNNWNIFTMGIAAFSLILCIVFIRKIFCNELDKLDEKVVLIGVFSMTCIFITLAGLLNSWTWGIKDAFISGNSEADTLRGLVYLRYFISYYPPCLMSVLVLIYKKPQIYWKYYKYTCVCSYLLTTFWIKITVDFVKNNSSGLGVLSNFALYVSKGGSVNSGYYLRGILVVIILFCSINFLFKKRNICTFLVMLSLIFIYQYLYEDFAGDGLIPQINYAYSDSSTKLIRHLRENSMDFSIYADNVQIEETGQSINYQIQFMNMKEKIYSRIPEKDSNNVIYITTRGDKRDGLIDWGFAKYKLDDNEYVYVKGNELIEEIDAYQTENNN